MFAVILIKSPQKMNVNNNAQVLSVSISPTTQITNLPIQQDNLNNIQTDNSVKLTNLIDTSSPSIAITSPQDKNIAKNTVLNIQADASDNVGVVKVEFYINSTLLCTLKEPPFTCSWKIPNKISQFLLKAIAYDAEGNSSISQINLNSK